MRKIIVILFLLVLSLSGLAYAEEKPAVLVFFSNHCHICLDLKAHFLPTLKEKYASKVDWFDLDSSDPENLKMLQSLSEQFNRGNGTVPTVFVGNKLFVGATEIKEGLEEGDLVVVDVEQDFQENARGEITETQEGIF